MLNSILFLPSITTAKIADESSKSSESSEEEKEAEGNS